MSESSSTPDIITTLLTRRSIRKFTAEPVAPEIVDVLEQAAQRAPSSQYLNDWSAIRVEDSDLKHRVAE
ncbi:MAG: nitroreductase family protein, partial [Bifidobacterium minimum]|nr:nitroreductase family protein [Bifidobacterium minimum]